MTKNELDSHIAALVGPDLVEKWWDSPNKNWNGFRPIDIYERDDPGKEEVKNYVLTYCYGK